MKTNAKGYTLVQLLMVIGIIAILSTYALINSNLFQRQIQFQQNYKNTVDVVREARSLALSGQSYPDTNDYDNDGLFASDGDEILPNGYIVHYDATGATPTIELYADVFASNVGQLDVDDVFLRSYILEEDMQITLDILDNAGGISSITNPNDFAFIYKVPDAQFEIINEGKKSLQFKIAQLSEDGQELRSKFLFINYFSGIPELLDEPFVNTEPPPSLEL